MENDMIAFFFHVRKLENVKKPRLFSDWLLFHPMCVNGIE